MPSIEGSALLVRVYVGEADHHDGKPLYQAIVGLLRERGLAGATVLRGIEGFGANAHLHTTRLLRLSEDLPILIEVVDQEDRIRAILPELDELVGDEDRTLLVEEYTVPAKVAAVGANPDDEAPVVDVAGAGPIVTAVVNAAQSPPFMTAKRIVVWPRPQNSEQRPS